LGDVNLLIGKNNGGKTTFLEAIEFSYQHYSRFFMSCCRRKEFIIQEKNKIIDYECLFYEKKHVECKLSVNKNFIFTSKNTIKIKDIYLNEVGFNMGDIGSSLNLNNVYDIWIENVKNKKMTPMLLETDLFKVDWIYMVWNTIVGNETEDYVIEMMKIIEPHLERIVFTSGEAQPTPFVKIKGMKERVHLGYLGEGARRLFVLAMFCAKSANSVLIVDEVDLGFHYSIMSKLWNMLLEWSKKFNIQIFVTTHNQDCLYALYKIVESGIENDVKIMKIDKNKTEPLVYDKNDLVEALESKVEIR
jgi:AAA15 family ATPase/GTPase